MNIKKVLEILFPDYDAVQEELYAEIYTELDYYGVSSRGVLVYKHKEDSDLHEAFVVQEHQSPIRELFNIDNSAHMRSGDALYNYDVFYYKFKTAQIHEVIIRGESVTFKPLTSEQFCLF